MCVAAIAWNAHPDWRMVAVGNRDEYHARPTAPLAAWGDGVIAGRDLTAGGTWLGVSESRFGLVTNLRVPGYPRAELASRGALVADWLRGAPPVQTQTMNPFNLWLAGPDGLTLYTNHPEPFSMPLDPCIHGLSNGAHGDRWFKTARLEAALADWLGHGSDQAPLFAALRDETTQSPDPEDAFSSVFIVNPTYGTRCSTVILVDAEGRGRITERSFDQSGAVTGAVALTFRWAR
ncbi:NRDE family protein [Novosphingobium sp.]|uniref:NRDE family protein n=1 Tax=Novosphingobium sp. TaxID=1874826 RepID=UPI0025F55A74|nr:NRDE family protein [Novosphingobium sp.]MCC6925474.1 NRDE family protein [Novosphingobium sp.]